jgi:hypothetical protein
MKTGNLKIDIFNSFKTLSFEDFQAFIFTKQTNKKYQSNENKIIQGFFLREKT